MSFEKTFQQVSEVGGTSGGRHFDDLPTYHYRNRGDPAPYDQIVASFLGDASELSQDKLSPATGASPQRHSRVTNRCDSTKNQEFINGASASVAQLSSGDRRSGAHISGVAQDLRGTAIAAGNPCGVARTGDGTRSIGATQYQLRDRLQHIEDIIADALYDHETGVCSHRRQAEAVLAVLLARGLNTDALDLS